MPDSFSEMRKRNAQRVLELVRQHGELSRADLARLADLSKATVSSITAELIESDLLRETGSITTEKGRRPVGLVFNPLGKVALGISIDDQHNFVVAVTDMDGRLLESSTGRVSGGLESVGVGQIINAASLDRKRLCATGLAVPGPISKSENDVFRRVSTELGENLKHQMHLQSLVDMAAIAEAHVDKLPADRLVLFLRTSHRLRSTLLYSNRLLSRHGDSGGEPGHVMAPWITDKCSCGQTGCVNTHVGNADVLRRAAEKGLQVQSVDALVEAAHAGNDAALTVVRDAGRAVGFAVAGLMNVLAPVTVIVGGPLAAAGDIFFDELRDTCRKYANEDSHACCDVKQSALGATSAAVGAAIYALANTADIYENGKNGAS